MPPSNTKATYDYDLVCIGSGPAGQRAAVQGAKLGKRVAVVEKRPMFGGCCVETGTIPSKTFRHAVVEHVGALNGGARRPRADIERLLGRVDHVVQAEARVVEDQLWRNDIDVITGVGSFVGPHELEVASTDGRGARRLTAQHVLIGVGTRPVFPDGITREEAEGLIITSDGVLHLDQLPKDLVVVGGGVIGIEYASIFGALGVRVTVVERHPRCLEFLDTEIVDELVHQMREHNVTFRFNEAVANLSIVGEDSRKPVVHLASGKEIVGDLVLYSIGRQGATDKLGLDAAGLEADPRGRLSVNERFQTDVPHIYAAGDAIGFPSLAATSSEQGRLAARHAFGQECKPMPEHFPIGIYSIPEISMVGKTEAELTEAKVPYVVGLARYREIARGQIVGDDTGLFKMLFGRSDRRLLGVHAIGTGATELIHIGQAVIALDGGLDYFLDTVFNYPTLAECLKVAALDAFNELEAQRGISRPS